MQVINRLVKKTQKNMVMKIKYLLILVVLFMLASCHHKQSNANPENDSIVNMAQVRKSVDSPPDMLTEDHHHTVHEERQVCYSSHLRPKSLHL